MEKSIKTGGKIVLWIEIEIICRWPENIFYPSNLAVYNCEYLLKLSTMRWKVDLSNQSEFSHFDVNTNCHPKWTARG